MPQVAQEQMLGEVGIKQSFGVHCSVLSGIFLPKSCQNLVILIQLTTDNVGILCTVYMHLTNLSTCFYLVAYVPVKLNLIGLSSRRFIAL